MAGRIVSQTHFRRRESGWSWPDGAASSSAGLLLQAPRGGSAGIGGPGVHTRSGDRIELTFRALDAGRGSLSFGFQGGMEHAGVTLDFKARRAVLNTSEWTRPQPVASAKFSLARGTSHRLVIEKTGRPGGLLRNADLAATLDGKRLFTARDVDILPEIGVGVRANDMGVVLERFVQRGAPQGIPEHLSLGGWQMLNRSSIEENLASIERGLRQAADAGVELLVTPETSLTGLFPTDKVTQRAKPVAAAERRLRRFIKGLKNAPHVIVGLPVWRAVGGHRRAKTRYNASRVYDPDGGVLYSGDKIHSCETEFWHGFRYHEFDVCGVPVTMHICHDGRYPDTWTVPIMFGARLVVHPANGGNVSGSVDGFERGAKRSTTTSHAFYIHVNGGGGSYITGPQKFNNLVAVSSECRRENARFPNVGPAEECLFHAKIRVHDAFGYWPARSFRASEQAARAFADLYRAMGGTREIAGLSG